MRSLLHLGVLLAAVLAACGDEGPTESGRGTVAGLVKDAANGQPVPGVAVTIGDKGSESDAAGHFSIPDVPAGDRAIVAAKTGYDSFEGTVSVDAGDTTDLTIELTASPSDGPPAAPPLVFTAARRGTDALFWPADPQATSHRVYWSTSPGVTPQTGAALPEVTTNEADHAGVTPGTTYYYVVTAINQAGEGPPSGEVIASSAPAIDMSAPHVPDEVVAPGTIRVLVRISSDLQLVSVVARSGAQSATLDFDPFDTARNAWSGDLQLDTAGVPVLISVTATDIGGATATTSVTVIPLPRITLTVTEPDEAAVSQATLRLRATCENCTSISVLGRFSTGGGDMVLASGPSPLDQTVSLAGFDGQLMTISLAAIAGTRSTGVDRHVYVESSPRLELSAAFGGSARILDVTPDRILAFDSAGGVYSLRQQLRSTGADQLLFREPPARPTIGYLTPAGAIFADTRLPSTLYESRDGELTNLGPINSAQSLRVAGGFAIWTNNVILTRRDLVSGTDVVVATNAGNTDNDVAANGDVVYWNIGYDIVRFRDGVSTDITNDGATTSDIFPATDGGIIAYRHGDASVALIGGSTVTLGLVDNLSSAVEYEVNNGWIAFRRPVFGGIRQVFLRSPSGDERQVSIFSGGANLEALGSDGSVIFTGGPENHRRYLVPPGGQPIDIGSSNIGRGRFVGTDAYVVIAGSLLRVH